MFGFGKGKKNKKKKGDDKAKEQDTDNEAGEEEAEEGGDEDEQEEDGEDEAPAKGGKDKGPKKSKKKLIMAVLAVLVLAGVGAGVYFSGILNGKKKETETTIIGPDGKPMEKPVFYTLPDFLVNLNSSGKQASYLKAIVVLELAHQTDVPLVEVNLPRISDAFTTYLRELRPSDLAGSAGIQRLREELLLRVNRALAPIKVNDVLFKEIVVQ